MKYLLLLSLSLSLLACSKNKGEEDGDPSGRTTVKFTNQLSRSFTNVKIAHIPAGTAILIKNAGTLDANATTGDIVINTANVGKVYFYYDEGDKTYYTDYGFAIAEGTSNNWNINSGTIFHQIQKTSPLYPK